MRKFDEFMGGIPTPLRGVKQEGARRYFRRPEPATDRNRRGFGQSAAPLVLERPDVALAIRWLTSQEANRLIDACGAHLRALVIFLIYTGVRIGEALWLDWQNVDLARRHVAFVKTKNGEARGVPCTSGW